MHLVCHEARHLSGLSKPRTLYYQRNVRTAAFQRRWLAPICWPSVAIDGFRTRFRPLRPQNGAWAPLEPTTRRPSAMIHDATACLDVVFATRAPDRRRAVRVRGGRDGSGSSRRSTSRRDGPLR